MIAYYLVLSSSVDGMLKLGKGTILAVGYSEGGNPNYTAKRWIKAFLYTSYLRIGNKTVNNLGLSVKTKLEPGQTRHISTELPVTVVLGDVTVA